MKCVLCAANSKYIHSSLAPWYLKAAVTDEEIQVLVEEVTINQSPAQVLERLIAYKPQVLGLSCYIWNIQFFCDLLAPLREALPETVILLGGPEATFRAQDLLTAHPQIDYVLLGEGEITFPAVLAALNAGQSLGEIPGVASRGKAALPSCPLTGSPPNPYTKEYLEALRGRIAYLETSRGCPYACAFCLSGRGDPARFFPLEQAKERLLTLANSGAQTVKLVDRTFNANPKRAQALVEFILAHYGTAIPQGVCFHFEMAGDILTPSLISCLNTAPKGSIQVEIGLQSFSEATLETVNRKTDLEKVERNVRQLLAPGNIHVHIDLIAGLPLENLASFAAGVNRAFGLHPHMLQLGFLKLLPGSPLADHPQGSFSPLPPYEVQETPWLSPQDLQELSRVEDTLDRLWNSGRFRRTLLFALAHSSHTPYQLLSLFPPLPAGTGLEAVAAQVLSTLSSHVPEALLRDEMIREWLSLQPTGRLPKCLWQPNRGKLLLVLDNHPETRRKKGIPRGVAQLSTGQIIYVDYIEKDPVTGRYPVNESHLE